MTYPLLTAKTKTFYMMKTTILMLSIVATRYANLFFLVYFSWQYTFIWLLKMETILVPMPQVQKLKAYQTSAWMLTAWVMAICLQVWVNTKLPELICHLD